MAVFFLPAGYPGDSGECHSPVASLLPAVTWAGPVNINTADANTLAKELDGIGPAKAQAIVEHRAKEPFSSPDDLRKVKGIGDKLYDSIRERITVGDAPASSGRGG